MAAVRRRVAPDLCASPSETPTRFRRRFVHDPPPTGPVSPCPPAHPRFMRTQGQAAIGSHHGPRRSMHAVLAPCSRAVCLRACQQAPGRTRALWPPPARPPSHIFSQCHLRIVRVIIPDQLVEFTARLPPPRGVSARHHPSDVIPFIVLVDALPPPAAAASHRCAARPGQPPARGPKRSARAPRRGRLPRTHGYDLRD